MFARRNEADLNGNPGLQDRLENALAERGGQVIVYGDTGVGKSSLVKYASEDMGLQTLTIECLSNKDYGALIEDGIRKLIDLKEIKRSKTGSMGADIEAGAKVSWLVSLKGKLKSHFAENTEFEVVDRPPMDVLVEAMQAADVQLLVLENFQNITDETTRSLIAQTMEFMADRAQQTGNIKVVVVGIARDAATLLSGSGSFTRRTTEVGVPRMPDEEVYEILTRGFSFLDLEFTSEAAQQMIFYSDGFPFFAHLLGLHVARAARRREAESIDEELVEASLQQVVQGVHESFHERTKRAFEAGGDVQPRRRIMEMLSESDQRKWRSSDVIDVWEEMIGKRSDYAFLHVALAQLASTDYGDVLLRTGTRNRYVYQFSDPHLRPYLRIRAAQKEI